MARPTPDPAHFPTGSEIERRLFADPGFKRDGAIGGSCPQIVEFMLDGFHGDFRARYRWWEFTIAIEGVIDPKDETEELFKVVGMWGNEFEAGYMPLDQSYRFIEASIAAFRQVRALGDGRDYRPTA